MNMNFKPVDGVKKRIIATPSYIATKKTINYIICFFKYLKYSKNAGFCGGGYFE